MSVQTGTATDWQDLLNALDTFLTSTGMALEPVLTGTGNGTISAKGGSASVAETITVTFTSATAFGVSGSVSGSLGTGAVGTPFTSTKTNFTITAGGTAFVSGDTFVFDVTPPWTSLRRTSGVEMIWQAPGNGGTDEIIVGAKEFHHVGADYYNWRLGGFQSFDSGAVFNQQLGYVGGAGQAQSSPVLNLWNGSIPYWFIANGRRVIVVAKVSTVYMCAYLGLIEAYMSPGSFPLPLAVGGSMAFSLNAEPAETGGSASWRWSNTSKQCSNFPKPLTDASGGGFIGLNTDVESQLRLRLPDGSWKGFTGSQSEQTFGKLFPHTQVTYTQYDVRPNLDGSYALFPIVMYSGGQAPSVPNQFGELEGVFEVTGFGNGSENTVTRNGIQHLVVQNVFRNGKADFFAVKLA
jgi:hypothetical protein